MARRGEAVDLIANGPAEMHARLSPRRSSLLRVLQAGLEKVERPHGRQGRSQEFGIRMEMKEKRARVGQSREEARAEKIRRKEGRDKRRQADTVTRKADVLNGIKQLST